jgi:anhydro-N-acetylmuramic acid kinase
MSGTSADGIDAVVVKLRKGAEPRLLTHIHKAFPAALRREILHACEAGSVSQICELNFELGLKFGNAAVEAIERAGLKPRHVRAIGSHGQTVHHLPQAKVPATLQIGEPAMIAERTGILTVGDFRVRDMAAGGQGAPLVPLADWLLFAHPRTPRLIQNIGGIANVTWLPPAARLDDVRAFDTGPGNMVIDRFVMSLTEGRMAYDRAGAWASKGHVRTSLLAKWLQHPFFRKKPPKTTGREMFGERFACALLADCQREKLPPEDALATVTALTARSIGEAYKRFVFANHAAPVPLQVVLGGGGARNRTLVSMLRAELPNAELLTHEDFGVPNEAKEAMAFAMLAARTLEGLPGNVPSATGACRPVVLGKIVPA